MIGLWLWLRLGRHARSAALSNLSKARRRKVDMYEDAVNAAKRRPSGAGGMASGAGGHLADTD